MTYSKYSIWVNFPNGFKYSSISLQSNFAFLFGEMNNWEKLVMDIYEE